MARKDREKKEKSKAPPAPGTLLPELTRAARSLRTFLSHTLSESGIYAGQEAVILALATEEPMTASAIAQAAGVKPPTMTRTLARMEAQGFIRRVADEHDGRQMRAALTEEGERRRGAIELAIRATEAHALAGLSDKEMRQFRKLLRKVNRNFGEKIEERDDENEG
jgi:DNA-binding MarR family transcriptional regulator